MVIYDLEPFLDKYEIKYNASKRGNQMVKCPNPDHDDRSPSTSVHLDKGVWNCQACGEGGSAVDLVMIVEGVDVREAIARTESMASGDSREVSRGTERSSIGLPGAPRNKPRTAKPIPAWRGFRT